jgi:hypothetical protein
VSLVSASLVSNSASSLSFLALALALLKDDEYKTFISEGTMQISHIHGRINKALNYLFTL